MKTLTGEFFTSPIEEPHDLLGLVRDSGFAWIHAGSGMVAWDVATEFDPGVGPQRFLRAKAWLDEFFLETRVHDDVDIPGTGPIAFCAFTFDESSGGSRIVVPRFVVGESEGTAWITTTSPNNASEIFDPQDPGQSGLLKITETLPDDIQWQKAVNEIVTAIEAGQLEKVVLARMLEVESTSSLSANRIVRNLAGHYPGCFTFLYDSFVGASPELLIRRLGEWIDSIPLAGSARRGMTPAEDSAIGKSLLESSKDLNEHRLAVTTVVDALGPLSADLSVESQPFLFLLDNVQHLGTKIQGRLVPNSDVTALSLAGALHPTAAVCGVPKTEAMNAIRDYEPFDRGLYSGPIGWVDRKGDGEWAIALRCAELDGKRARAYAGAGIVDGSEPSQELEETQIKLAAILRALQS